MHNYLTYISNPTSCLGDKLINEVCKSDLARSPLVELVDEQRQLFFSCEKSMI